MPSQPTRSTDRPLLSVLMITYNHEKFIAQAIESVLMQRVSFPIELVIGEDRSPDGTRAIVERYARQHPDLIRPLLREANVGAVRNFAETFDACRGEYVAMLEGDDYWTYPHKLQKQVEFLQAHPASSASFHDALLITDETGETRRYCDPKPSSLVSVENLLSWNCVPTCSLVYRREYVAVRPPSLSRLSMQDWPINLLLAQRGDLGYIDEPWSAYRIHAGGMWSAMSEATRWKNILQLYQAIGPCLDTRYRPRLAEVKKDAWYKLTLDLATGGDPRGARRAAWSYLLSQPRALRLPRGNKRNFARFLLGLGPRKNTAAS